jgi:ComF family protein
LRRILHALKYDGRRVIARTLAVKMRERCIDVLTDADAVVPVPLHWRRRWTRGFNQAADLAEGLGLPVLHALRRRRRTSSQTDLPADERHANVQDAFTLRRGITVADLCLVVVDDVRTTGATLEACARTLLEAGAGEVRALTAAVVSTRLSGEPRSRPRPSSGRL